MIGNESIDRLHIVGAGSAEARRVPGVIDLVVSAMQQENAVFNTIGLVVSLHHTCEHVPFARLDPRGEGPVAIERITALGLAGASSRKNEGRCDQRVGILFPNRVLCTRIEHAKHPVVAGQIGEIPCDRRVRLAECIGAIDERDIVEFRSPDALRLQDTE